MPLRAPALSIFLGIALGVVGLAFVPACDRANPLYRGQGSGQAGATGEAGVTGAAGEAEGGKTGSAGASGTAGTTPGLDGGAAADGAGLDGPLSGCIDNDGDGFGVGPGCAAGDCDDTNAKVGRTSSRPCYDGKAGTIDVGVCHGGAQTCTDGVWSSCLGQVLPALGEACNGADDDCNGTADDNLGMASCGLGACAQTTPACAAGAIATCQPGTPQTLVDDCDGIDNDCDGAVDEDCATACVHVVPNGDDMGATGTTLRPFRTVQGAINFAAGAAGRPKLVCVAGGLTCLDTNVYSAADAGTFTMANGISVYGNYESRTWSRCPFGTTGFPNLTVTLQSRTSKGVIFPATVTSSTILDGVHVTRAGNGMGGGNATTTIGISVEGAKQVVISNVVLDDSDNVATTYGVNLTAGAEALITRSAIFGGAGTVDAIGIHSTGSKPTIRDNCGAFDPTTGRCTAPCGLTSLGIHGRFGQAAGTNGIGIDLVDSPGAVVERNAVCGAQAKLGAGVRIAGAAAGTVVRGNSIVAQGGTLQAVGVLLGACADASPWIAANELIEADAAPLGMNVRVAGVSATGACHPAVDGNAKITGGGEGMPASSTGVFCGADMGIASRCLVTNNKLVQGSASVHPATSTAVACDAGGCARVAGNKLVGNGGTNVLGLSLAASGPLVERNDITGGCGGKSSIGVLAEDAFARVENNVIHGASCGLNQATLEADGLRVHVAAGGNEMDVHSNTIEAGGAGQCSGSAARIGLGAGQAPSGARGVFRNNILGAGACAIARYDFLEDTAKTSPRLFENNDLEPTGGTPNAQLYLRGSGQPAASLAAINALPGSSNNLSAAPLFVAPGDFHLGAGSPCVNAGTAVGAPKTDFDGKPRDDMPDIGAFEK
jgi:hypothetical protein